LVPSVSVFPDAILEEVGVARFLRLVLVVSMVAAVPMAVASADAPPGPYFNGFETNTAGWFNFSGGTITRQPSGFMTGAGGYANGISSAEGNWHARLGIDPSPGTCASGGGPQPVFTGPYTNWGGYSSIFPTGGYTTRVDVYLDVQWAMANLDRRFDWSSAINDTSGQHRRDFVFNVGTDALGFVMSGSNNTTRCGADPANPLRTPIHISVSGWYTFEHVFTGVPDGPLTVLLRVMPAGTTTPLGTWVLTDASDIIGVTVGGNRYGWFVQNEIDDLAIDNSERTGILSTPGCEVKISDGGSITTTLGDKATLGGNAKVSMSGATSGQQEYQDHGPTQPLRFKALTVQAVICNEDDGGVMSAEIYGLGRVDGEGEFEYQIKLEDQGEPGTNDRYGILIPAAAYNSGYQQLDGGNVQIRGTVTS
jgi:hypothetical protein